MNIVVIGADPPCPRCRETYDRVKRVVRELDQEISLKKIVYTSEGAQRVGKVGTGHDVAEWAGVKMNWNRVHELASGEWTHELDDFLMPLKETAEKENWIMTPVVVIDGEIAHFGSVPSIEDLRTRIPGKKKM